MEVVDTTLAFTYQRKKYAAALSMFTPSKTPMLRVQVHTREFKELVFVFYKIKRGELFWYELPDPWKEGMAKAIADLLVEALFT